MAKSGLPKKYAKMGFKKGWAEYKKSKRRTAPKRTPAKRTRRKTTMAKKRNYRRSAKKLITKQFIDGAIDSGAQYMVKSFVGDSPLYSAGIKFGLGWVRNNKTLMGQGVTDLALSMFLGNMISGKGQEPWIGQ